LIENLDHINLN